MDVYVIRRTTLSNIASSIRSKTLGTELIDPENMDNAINQVYEAGKIPAYENCWEAIQKGGTLTDFTHAYENYYNDENFRPIYDISPTNASYMFQSTNITDLKGILERQGVTLDYSNCTNFQSMCMGAKITRFPVLSAVSAFALVYVFGYCGDLISIDAIVLKDDGSTTFNNTFVGCFKLEEIYSITGIIGNNIDLQYSPLSHDTIARIISHLSDTATSKTLTLSKAAVNKAFETGASSNDGSTSPEWLALVATKQNWTISLV